MELRKRLNPKIIFFLVYFLAFFAYIIYGLQPAEATEVYSVDGNLAISSIGLSSDVTDLDLTSEGLSTPDTVVGSYSRYDNKTLLIGHSTGVFKDLDLVKIGDTVNYDGLDYNVSKLVYIEKDAIDMNDLLSPAEKDTLVIMTCAGTLLGDGDATHRLILTAIR